LGNEFLVWRVGLEILVFFQALVIIVKLKSLSEGASKVFRTESITKCTLTTINYRGEATRTVMAVKLTRLTHKIAIQLHLVAESCDICSCRSRRPVRKLLDTPAYSVLVRCRAGSQRYDIGSFPTLCITVRFSAQSPRSVCRANKWRALLYG
jgi:hypothetical protein